MLEEEKVINININLLNPNPYQPRKEFNEQKIQELAKSIKEYGIINPILIRKKNDQYEIIAGERRYRAAKSIGLSTIPAIVKDIDDNKMAELALIENLQRENLSSIEEAKAYLKIINLTNITQNKLAQILGKSQPMIANKIRLLSLPEIIQQAIIDNKISERHARSLLKIENESYQLELLHKIIEQKLTVKELDELLKKEQKPKEKIIMEISDINQSLKVNKIKEEKESDNMNNQNFFPNNNNQIYTNNNASLNTLNAQNVYGTQLPANNEMVMPSAQAYMNNNSEIVNNQIMNQPLTQIPTTNMTPAPSEEYQPLFNNYPTNPIPDFTANTPVNNVVETNQIETPIINSIQEPTIQNNNGIVDTQITNNNQFNEMPATIESTTPTQTSNNELLDSQNLIQETPIFSIPNIEVPIVESVAQPNFEVPISLNNEVTIEKDNLTKTTEILNQNNINYKLYSNEQGHCIIIEL